MHGTHTQDDNRHAADLLITGQAAHQEGGDTHGQQSNHQRLLAAHLVTEVTEQHGAERTSQEGDSECGERHNLSQCRIGDVGEEDCAEVAGGCDGVTVVVIELDGSAHHRSGDDFRNRILLHGFRHGRSCTCRHNPFFSPHAAHKPQRSTCIACSTLRDSVAIAQRIEHSDRHAGERLVMTCGPSDEPPHIAVPHTEYGSADEPKA